MFHDSELELKAAGKNIFLPAFAIVCFLALVLAILSSNAILALGNFGNWPSVMITSTLVGGNSEPPVLIDYIAYQA